MAPSSMPRSSMHRKYMKSWNSEGFPKNILMKMLLQDQILHIRGNYILGARCGGVKRKPS